MTAITIHPQSPASVTVTKPAWPTSQARRTLLACCAAMLLSYLPFSGVSAVLGTIGHVTSASASDLQWVTDAFALALASVVLSAGVIGDLFGRKRVVVGGLACTLTGSATGLAAGLVHGSGAVALLWLAQAVCGLGAGAIMSSTLALITATVSSPAERNSNVALWSGALVLALGAGPFMAAVIVEHAAWPWLFAPILIGALMLIPVAAVTITDSSASEGRRLDWAGQGTGMAAIAAIIFGVIEGSSSGWGSGANVVGLLAGALLLATFVLVERRVTSPLLRLELFRSPAFSAAGFAAMVVLFSLVGLLFTFSLFFSTAQHLSAIAIAERLAFLFAANALAGLVAARLQRRFSPRVPLIAGLAIAATGMLTLTSVSQATGLIDIIWRLALTGAGCGLVMSTASAAAVDAAPGPLKGMAGAANNALRQFGAALSPAVLGAVLTAGLASGQSFASALKACTLTAAIALAIGALVCTIALRPHN